MATGSAQSYFGNDQFAKDAPGLKTIDDALEVRSRLFGAFEMAEREPDPETRREWMTFVVVGAGPTGVEMAGQIAELSHRSLQRNFRSIDPERARVVLLDGSPKLLAAFPDSLQRAATKALEKLGVEIHLSTMVSGVDPHGIDTNSSAPELQRINARTMYVVLPLAKVYKPIWEYDAKTLVDDLSAHLVFGAATATAFRALSPT